MTHSMKCCGYSKHASGAFELDTYPGRDTGVFKKSVQIARPSCGGQVLDLADCSLHGAALHEKPASCATDASVGASVSSIGRKGPRWSPRSFSKATYAVSLSLSLSLSEDDRSVCGAPIEELSKNTLSPGRLGRPRAPFCKTRFARDLFPARRQFSCCF